MLRHIRVTNIGPAGEIALKPGRRTTLLTGDNGLGRTLLLDSAWRTLTGRWPAEANPELRTGFAAFARPDAEQAQIETVIEDDDGAADTRTARWRRSETRRRVRHRSAAGGGGRASADSRDGFHHRRASPQRLPVSGRPKERHSGRDVDHNM